LDGRAVLASNGWADHMRYFVRFATSRRFETR
jgi:hypothetical protein